MLNIIKKTNIVLRVKCLPYSNQRKKYHFRKLEQYALAAKFQFH
jgi:hypothetical protein